MPNKITKFDRTNIEGIAKEALEAVKKALEPYGLVCRDDKGSFSPSLFNMKIAVSTVESEAAAAAKTVHPDTVRFGMAPFGTRVTLGKGTEVFKIIKAAGRVNYTAEKESDGKQYRIRMAACVPVNPTLDATKSPVPSLTLAGVR